MEDVLAYMNGSATKEDYEMHSKQAISLEDFEKVEVRVGTVLEVRVARGRKRQCIESGLQASA